MWLIGGVIAAGIIGGIISEQCREKDAEIQSLNEKCNTLTGKCDTLKKECRQRDETIAALREENELLNNEIQKLNPEWIHRQIVANLKNQATYRAYLDD